MAMAMGAREAEQAGDRSAIVHWLQAFGRASGARDAEVGRWLLAADRTRAFELAGAASIYELAERLLGWEPRTTYERLRVARALEGLPLLAERLAAGDLHWSKVREISRVATADTEAQWIENAAACSVRELERQVRGRRPGDLPSDPPDPSLVRHRFQVELPAEGLALWEEAQDFVRRNVDPKLAPDQVWQHLVRAGLAAMQAEAGGASPPGEAEGAEGAVHAARKTTYQVALMVCAGCQQGFRVAGGTHVPVPNTMVERAACDCACVGFVDEADERVAAAHVDKSALPKSMAVHVGTDRVRTSRGVSPKVERRVRLRDKDACQVPGCRNRLFTEIHHIEMRMDGGPNTPDNLLVICGTHHQLLHEGRMWIEGTSPAGLVFRHADGTVYGRRLQPDALEANHEAFGVLRGMGFREKDVRYLLRDARGEFDRAGAVPTTEQLVEAALRLSRRGKAPSAVAEEAAPYLVRPRGREVPRAAA